MATVKQAVVQELAEWFTKYRKPITTRSLKPILKRHITTKIGFDELIDYLGSQEGKRAFGKALKAKLKR